ncbi:oligosaccharide flippase family protein [Algicella marina]|uniref:Oligosaccharide flippase family protein n=1 Tax=Algicella marina TaxID=2683284 RepID=A0A6P1T0N0_9RHOB|nr:oligosaccharide flippase family protein [Algicella marina]QHQ34072.1 oligosaccharide flippase family protein [Algicella marina]
MSRLASILKDNSLFARAMRSSFWTIFGYGTSQILRLASNLILTRILFPEAFGLMALVMVVMQGLTNFSDVGINTSIQQNKRGDDEDFLNTAWTLNVIRGLLLWLLTVLVAVPIANFYEEPQLAQLIPVAGAILVIQGFFPTRLESANRHLNLGRVTLLEMAIQIIGIVATVLFAWLLQSVWALVIGGIVGAVSKILISNVFVPGTSNRFRWERDAVRDLVGFGKWIFLSTAFGFILSQGDKIVLAKYLTLSNLGVYNIGYFLASFPLLLATSVAWRILIPIYRERPPGASAENFRGVRKMRFALTGGIVSMLIVAGFVGVPLVHLLYDSRYYAAGAMVVGIAVMQIPMVIIMSYDQAVLAAGESRYYAALVFAKAVLQIGGLILGIHYFGLLGGIAGQAIGIVLVYPMVIWLTRRAGAWDPLHDGVFAAVGLLFGGLIVWTNHADLLTLLDIGS